MGNTHAGVRVSGHSKCIDTHSRHQPFRWDELFKVTQDLNVHIPECSNHCKYIKVSKNRLYIKVFIYIKDRLFYIKDLHFYIKDHKILH